MANCARTSNSTAVPSRSPPISKNYVLWQAYRADFADCQVAASDLPVMAQEAAGQWTGTFNPLPLQEADFLRLYETAF